MTPTALAPVAPLLALQVVAETSGGSREGSRRHRTRVDDYSRSFHDIARTADLLFRTAPRGDYRCSGSYRPLRLGGEDFSTEPDTERSRFEIYRVGSKSSAVCHIPLDIHDSPGKH